MQFNRTNFNQQVGSIARSLTAQRDNIQTAVVFALEQVQSDGNTNFLDVLMDKLRPVRAVRMETLKNYIKEACPNLKYAKAKDNKLRFMKRKKSEPLEVQIPDYAWYEQDKDGEVKPDMDVMQMASAFQKRIEKALKGESERSIKTGQTAFAKQLSQSLSDFLSAKPASGEKQAKKQTASA